jgi:hypothetical protein
MCAFTPQGDFNTAMLQFITAQAGLIAPRPGLEHHNLCKVTCSGVLSPDYAPSAVRERRSALAASAADRHPFMAVPR